MIKNYILSLFLMLGLGILYVSGQGTPNTPASPTRPFPQNVTYAYGLKASTSALSSSDVLVAYNSWFGSFYNNCGGGKCRIEFDNTSQTVSEGIGYGMLIAAYMGDQPL